MEVHQEARRVASQLGLDNDSVETIIQTMQDRMPMMLIGGYNVDVMIIACAAVLRLEDHMQTNPVDLDPDSWIDEDRDRIIDTVEQMIQIAYAGAM